MMTRSEAIVCLGAVMRRRLAVFWITLVVTALGVVAAPPAAAADLPPGEYLWAATTTQTLVYDRSQLTPVLVEQTDNTPTGGLVRSVDQFGDWVFVTTTGGIDMFDATTGQVLDSFSGSANGYRQVAAVPSIAGTTVYGLQTGGTVVDVFLANSSQLVTSITLRGPATYMSPARPPNGDYIVLGSVLNNNDQQYLSAAITTADNSVNYFNAPTRQVVNGAVWGPTDGRAYLSSTNLDSTTGSIGTYAPPLAYANTPIAAGVTPKQIAINTDGSRLYLPALDATGHSSIQIVDTSTLSTVEALELGTISTFGVPAFAPDGKLYVPPGATGLTNSVVMVDTKGAEPVSLPIGGSSSVLGVLVGDLPSAVQATGGANQKMYVDRQFDSPAVVTVVDPAGTPLPGQLVSFTSPDINAVHFQGCAICLVYTGPDGTATSPPMVAGSTPGAVSVVASVEGATGATFPLTILPLPTPPTITALAAGDGSVGVTFTPGDDRGISPPTGYTVTATDVTTPANGGQTAQGATSPITVTGLTNGDTYTFTVTANTPKGDWTSAPSERINVGIPATISGNPPQGTVGTPYHFSFTVAGVPTPTVILNPGTSLPDGLTFDAATATISGTPAADSVGPAFVLITATNAVGSAQVTPRIVINPAGPATDPEPTPTATSSTTPTTTTTSPAPGAGSGSPPYGSAAAAYPPLAATGMPVGQLIGGAAVLLVAGGVLLLYSRRRRTAG